MNRTDLDAFLDRQAAGREVSIAAGETRRDAALAEINPAPPLPGRIYAVGVVHHSPFGRVCLAIAHRQAGQFLVDVLEESVGLVEAADIVRRYGATLIRATERDSDDASTVAIGGAVGRLRALQ